jgi:hypothetical protein
MTSNPTLHNGPMVRVMSRALSNWAGETKRLAAAYEVLGLATRNAAIGIDAFLILTSTGKKHAFLKRQANRNRRIQA